MSEPTIHVIDDMDATAFYRDVVVTLQAAGLPFLVGGTYSLERHAGIQRPTKDLDLFIRRETLDPAAAALTAGGFDVVMAHPHWLAKATRHRLQVDLIFAGGNGLARVDDEWFAHGVRGAAFGADVLLCPPEEMIWSKSFVMERERFDGADVLHIVRESAERLDWRRLLRRFGPNAAVLLAHLTLFRFVYPSEARRIPRWVVDTAQAQASAAEARAGRLCRGTLLSRSQYKPDIEDWGYRDARLPPYGIMTAEDIAAWSRED